jgi:hypothetical protein
MTLKSVMLQLSESQIVLLDRQAKREGVSRSQIVRSAVNALLSPTPDDDVARRYAAAYPTRELGVDEWGDRDQWHAAAERARAGADRGAW